MLQNITKFLGGDPHKREIEKLSELIAEINGLEVAYEKLSDEELHGKTGEFRRRLEEGETVEDLLPEAFAAVREASKRTTGLRHYDVQLIGGITLHHGKIAEMRTGEGKTLVATLPMYLNALAQQGVHLVTVNDYLARRDARWMAPIYQVLGMTVGVLQMASRTDNGKKAFIVDFERVSNQEDQNQLRLVTRAEAYQADITYGTNSEFGFDYLRDNLTMRLEERVQRGHHYAIVDEVDNILIDEARTPLIISGPASEDTEWYVKMAQVVRQLQPEDYEIFEKERSIALTEVGEAHVEVLLGTPLRDPERPEDINPEQARLLGFLEQGLRAQHLYKRNKDYLVQAGKVIIVDEFTGRLMPGRRWSEGLHQAVEAKEGVRVEPENVTYATITLQNYFRMYDKLAGMTGTALTEEEEFHKIYKLDVLPIPTNLEYIASKKDSDLAEVREKDSLGYSYSFYMHSDDQTRTPVYWKRKDYTDVVFRTEEAKLRSITQEIANFHVRGRPQLVGTTSVEHSERLSSRLQTEMLRRLLQILLIRQAWLDKNGMEMFEKPVAELQPLNVNLDDLNTGELRPFARSLGISLNPEDPENIATLMRVLKFNEEDKPRLTRILQGGIPHQVLNARKHDEESQIIARAGAFGAVTIATNMAGRGVDIKLGGELPEYVLQETNRVLGKVQDDPFDMTADERYKALQELNPDQYGIYEISVKAFFQYIEEMKRVRELGGLHVIGSERHEARRIDNQLRGRAARQGDPGSSRFYLSLEDELMRLFGGSQVESLWKRVFFDESQPLEIKLLGRLVEQSQERVEGANFDVRKHLLEYDDVLNSQRKRIYGQRDRVFTKEDLSEDVIDMLHTEMEQRIPTSLKDPEGPWRLMAYLEEIQPAFQYESVHFPSFILKMLQDEVRNQVGEKDFSVSNLKVALLDLAQRALQAEKDHLIHTTENILEKGEQSLKRQQEEVFETLDAFWEGLREPEGEQAPIRPQETLTQLSSVVRLPLRLNPDQLRRLPEADTDLLKDLRRQISSQLLDLHTSRIVITLERRLEESLNLKTSQVELEDWDDFVHQILDSLETTFNQRMERYLGKDGEITHTLDPLLDRKGAEVLESRVLLALLLAMTQGTRLAFDSRTHKKSAQRTTRLKYQFLVARLLEDSPPSEITERILNHLEEGLIALQRILGIIEINRMIQNKISFDQFGPWLKEKLSSQVGVERFAELAGQTLEVLTEEEKDSLIQILGAWVQNESYRELLLRVISEQWVEYLTQMEALRVSIGMEAYAQRDPLVQYKSKASEMFKSLLAEIRIGVISRIFTYQSRRSAATTVDREQVQETVIVAEQKKQSAGQTGEELHADKKRRRHRH